MNTAKKYFRQQFSIPEFKRSYFQEKIKLDIEYQLEELRSDIESHKPDEELIKKVDSIKQYVTSV
jgi:hypothetical protein